MRVVSLTILLASLIQGSYAFAVLPNGPNGAVKVKSRFSPLSMAEDGDDPTKVWYAEIANGIQNLLTNSPLNEAKKALVKSLAGEYDEAATKAKLMALIDDNPVLMLSFVKWPFCVKAKVLLDDLGTKYTVVELDQLEDGKAIRAEMANVVGRTSVPAIWIGGNFVGGCNDGPMGGIVSLSDSGELNGLLAGVGAL